MTEITWSDLHDAGIDTDSVQRQMTSLGTSEFAFESESGAIVFGPAVDMVNGGTHGFDITVYDPSESGYGDQIAQEWAASVAETLDIVKRYAIR